MNVQRLNAGLIGSQPVQGCFGLLYLVLALLLAQGKIPLRPLQRQLFFLQRHLVLFRGKAGQHIAFRNLCPAGNIKFIEPHRALRPAELRLHRIDDAPASGNLFRKVSPLYHGGLIIGLFRGFQGLLQNHFILLGACLAAAAAKQDGSRQQHRCGLTP